MRVNFLITCIAIAAVVIITTFALTFQEKTAVRQETPYPAEQIAKQVEEEPKPQTEYQYLLKDHEGRLAVFFNGETVPQKIFDVYISTLPEYDRGQLKQGVPVKDYEELVKRIEDYIS